MEFRNIGTHPEDLDDGGIVGVGEFVSLSAEQLRAPHNKRLVDEGILIPTETEAAKSRSKRDTAAEEE